jgi:hypothetical protein
MSNVQVAREPVLGDLVRSQLMLFGGLILCMAIRPQGLGANSGISYYGVHRQTVIPYTIGLLGTAWLTQRALRAAGRTWFGYGFGLLTTGIVLTPYTVSDLFDWTHTVLGAALFILMLVLSGRLTWALRSDPLCVLLLVTEFTGGVIAAIYVLPVRGFLIQGQLLFLAAFEALLLRALRSGRPADSCSR